MEKKAVPLIIFGENLKERRIDLGMTQEKLAELADIDRTYIYRLESGKRIPSLAIIIRLAQAFRQTPGQFLDKMLKK